METEFFHSKQHEQTFYTLQYGEQSIMVSSYGARLIEWLVPCQQAKDNKLNLLLNHGNFDNYVNDPSYMGAVIGPIPNRLRDAEFNLDGRKYTLHANEGENSLHSSNYAFSELDFILCERGDNFLILENNIAAASSLTQARQKLQIKYSLLYSEKQYRLLCEYMFVSEQDTVCNICNHSYFRLWDQKILDKYQITGQEALKQLELTMPSNFYTPTDEHMLTTGEIRSVDDLAIFDFRSGKTLENGLNFFKNTKIRGYDHNFILERDYNSFEEKNEQYWSKPTYFNFLPARLKLAFRTTEIGAQFYTANYLHADQTRTKENYDSQTAFCFECQAIPNSLHYAHLPSLKVAANQPYRSFTEISFSAY